MIRLRIGRTRVLDASQQDAVLCGIVPSPQTSPSSYLAKVLPIAASMAARTESMISWRCFVTAVSRDSCPKSSCHSPRLRLRGEDGLRKGLSGVKTTELSDTDVLEAGLERSLDVGVKDLVLRSSVSIVLEVR